MDWDSQMRFPVPVPASHVPEARRKSVRISKSIIRDYNIVEGVVVGGQPVEPDPNIKAEIEKCFDKELPVARDEEDLALKAHLDNMKAAKVAQEKIMETLEANLSRIKIKEDEIEKIRLKKRKLRQNLEVDLACLENLIRGTTQTRNGGRIVFYEIIDYGSMSRAEVMKSFDESNQEKALRLEELKKSVRENFRPKIQDLILQNQSNETLRPQINHQLAILKNNKERSTFICHLVNLLKGNEQIVVFPIDTRRLLDFDDDGVKASMLDQKDTTINARNATDFCNGETKVLLIWGKYDGLQKDIWKNVKYIVHERPCDRPAVYHGRNRIAKHSSLPKVNIFTEINESGGPNDRPDIEKLQKRYNQKPERDNTLKQE